MAEAGEVNKQRRGTKRGRPGEAEPAEPAAAEERARAAEGKRQQLDPKKEAEEAAERAEQAAERAEQAAAAGDADTLEAEATEAKRAAILAASLLAKANRENFNNIDAIRDLEKRARMAATRAARITTIKAINTELLTMLRDVRGQQPQQSQQSQQNATNVAEAVAEAKGERGAAVRDLIKAVLPTPASKATGTPTTGAVVVPATEAGEAARAEQEAQMMVNQMLQAGRQDISEENITVNVEEAVTNLRGNGEEVNTINLLNKIVKNAVTAGDKALIILGLATLDALGALDKSAGSFFNMMENSTQPITRARLDIIAASIDLSKTFGFIERALPVLYRVAKIPPNDPLGFGRSHKDHLLTLVNVLADMIDGNNNSFLDVKDIPLYNLLEDLIKILPSEEILRAVQGVSGSTRTTEGLGVTMEISQINRTSIIQRFYRNTSTFINNLQSLFRKLTGTGPVKEIEFTPKEREIAAITAVILQSIIRDGVHNINIIAQQHFAEKQAGRVKTPPNMLMYNLIQCVENELVFNYDESQNFIKILAENADFGPVMPTDTLQAVEVEARAARTVPREGQSGFRGTSGAVGGAGSAGSGEAETGSPRIGGLINFGEPTSDVWIINRFGDEDIRKFVGSADVFPDVFPDNFLNWHPCDKLRYILLLLDLLKVGGIDEIDRLQQATKMTPEMLDLLLREPAGRGASVIVVPSVMTGSDDQLNRERRDEVEGRGFGMQPLERSVSQHSTPGQGGRGKHKRRKPRGTRSKNKRKPRNTRGKKSKSKPSKKSRKRRKRKSRKQGKRQVAH